MLLATQAFQIPKRTKRSPLQNIIRAPRYLVYMIKCLFVFKTPFSIIRHYVRRTSPRSKIIVMRNGLKIHVSDHPHDIITILVIMAKQDYGRVERDSLVIDIGANIGVFSLFAARAGAKKVYAVEPNQRAYEILLRNIAANAYQDVIIPFKLAMSSTSGQQVKFPVAPSPYNQILPGDVMKDYELVKTTNLEDFLNASEIARADLLKLDCEGHEYEIFFKTPDVVFSMIGRIVMEFHPGPVQDLITFLKRHRHNLTHFDPDSAILKFVREFDPEKDSRLTSGECK
jgi:FkbM family methyltransferase